MAASSRLQARGLTRPKFGLAKAVAAHNMVVWWGSRGEVGGGVVCGGLMRKMMGTGEVEDICLKRSTSDWHRSH